MERDPPPSTAFATSTELLARLRTSSEPTAWQHYTERYRPMLVAFGRGAGLPADDAEDVAQQTLMAFFDALRAGRYDREKGRLRSWLFGIARHTLHGWQRKHRREPAAPGNQTRRLEQAAADDDLSGMWEREWQLAVTRHCLETVRREVEPATFLAFQLMVHKEWTAARVAAHMGIKEAAVFGARQRVVRRLRELAPRLEESF